jgi:hypothetical protein
VSENIPRFPGNSQRFIRQNPENIVELQQFYFIFYQAVGFVNELFHSR